MFEYFQKYLPDQKRWESDSEYDHRMIEELNTAGKDSWELVSAIGSSSDFKKVRFFFRRVKETPAPSKK